MNKQWLWVVTPIGVGIVLILLLVAFNSGGPASGLVKTDVKVGTGPAAGVGDKVMVHYTGTLANGKKFDSSFDHPGAEPFEFRLGEGSVIKGWDLGVEGMKVGGIRKLVIPSELGYGKKGSPPKIPPNSELHFEIELLKIN